MGVGTPKQYRLLAGMPMLELTVRKLLSLRNPQLDGVVIGAAAEPAESVLRRLNHDSIATGVLDRSEPGSTRAETVLKAVERVAQTCTDEDWILVHDAARPLLKATDVERLIDVVGERDDGGLLGWAVADSVSRVDGDAMTESVSRDGLWRAATPQLFRLGLLRESLSAAIARGDVITDEASVMFAAGYRPRLVQCSPSNFKITTVEDFAMAQQMLGVSTGIRVGTGFDVHALVDGRPLILGGVEIAFDRGLDGHSDADVLLHAIADACLGAAALGDIGRHFPDSDSQYAGADSRQLLRHVVGLLRAGNLVVNNIDATVIAEAPKLAPHIAQMVANIASDCAVAPGAVNVKATTTEGLGFTGRGQGIAAQATVTVSGGAN